LEFIIHEYLTNNLTKYILLAHQPLLELVPLGRVPLERVPLGRVVLTEVVVLVEVVELTDVVTLVVLLVLTVELVMDTVELGNVTLPPST